MRPNLKRNIFVNLNKYHEKILQPIYLTWVILVALFVLYADLIFNYPGFSQVGGAGKYFRDQIGSFELTVALAGLFFMVLFLTLIFWAHQITGKILGPYSRILADMDLKLAGKKRGPFKVRDGDECFETLVLKLNNLVAKLEGESRKPVHD